MKILDKMCGNLRLIENNLDLDGNVAKNIVRKLCSLCLSYLEGESKTLDSVSSIFVL